MNESFEHILDNELKRSGIKLTVNNHEQVKHTIRETIAAYNSRHPAYVTVGVKELADELSSVAVTAIRRLHMFTKEENAHVEQIEINLQKQAFSKFLGLRDIPPRLKVLVTKKDLRELGSTEVLTHVHLSISEEAFEWTAFDKDGKSIDRLVPE